MILLRIINIIVFGFYIFLFYRFEKSDKHDSLFLIGILLLIQYILQRLISHIIYRKDSLNIKLNTTRLIKIIWVFIGLLGLVMILNYKIQIIIIDTDISVFLFCFGLIVFFESINRIWSDIVITNQIVGKRYLAKFLRWDKIYGYDIRKDTIELWTRSNRLKIRFSKVDKFTHEKVIGILNQRLSDKFKGELYYEDNALIINK